MRAVIECVLVGSILALSGACGVAFTDSGKPAVGGSGGGGSGGSVEPAGGQGGQGGKRPAPCTVGDVDDLVDDFADGALLPNWRRWQDAAGMMEEVQGQLVLTLRAGNGSNFAEVISQQRYDLTECGLAVELVVAPTQATNAPIATTLRVSRDETNFLSIAVYSDRIYFSVRTQGNTTDVQDVAFDAEQHRWWRVREGNGSVSFETSPDGSVWDLRLAGATPSWIDDVEIAIGGGTWAYIDAPGLAVFDNVNILP